MNYEMTLMVADNPTNGFMKAFDLRNDGEYFVSLMDIQFSTDAVLNEDYFMNIIDKSIEGELEGMKVPGIIFCGNAFLHKGVTKISDGKKCFYVPRESSDPIDKPSSHGKPHRSKYKKSKELS